MKKVALFLLLTYVVAAPCVSYLILSLPWSVTSKVICLIWCWFVSLSVVSLAIQELLDSWSTTKSLAGSNRLATLAKKEQEIAEAKNSKAGTLTSDRILDDFLMEKTHCSAGVYHFNTTH